MHLRQDRSPTHRRQIRTAYRLLSDLCARARVRVRVCVRTRAPVCACVRAFLSEADTLGVLLAVTWLSASTAAPKEWNVRHM